MRLHYTAWEAVVGRIPLVGETLLTALHRSSEDLIASWRDQFRRRPFDVSGNLARARRRGADPEMEGALQQWRRRVFNTLALAIAFLFLMTAALVGTGLAALVRESLAAGKGGVVKALGLGCILSRLLAWLWMTWKLPRVLAARP